MSALEGLRIVDFLALPAGRLCELGGGRSRRRSDPDRASPRACQARRRCSAREPIAEAAVATPRPAHLHPQQAQPADQSRSSERARRRSDGAGRARRRTDRGLPARRARQRWAMATTPWRRSTRGSSTARCPSPARPARSPAAPATIRPRSRWPAPCRGSTASRAPSLPGLQVADVLAGCHATIAMLAALQARERTGRGQHVDVAMSDACMPLLMVTMGRHDDLEALGATPDGSLAPKGGVWECADGGFTLHHRHGAALTGRASARRSDAPISSRSSTEPDRYPEMRAELEAHVRAPDPRRMVRPARARPTPRRCRCCPIGGGGGAPPQPRPRHGGRASARRDQRSRCGSSVCHSTCPAFPSRGGASGRRCRARTRLQSSTELGLRRGRSGLELEAAGVFASARWTGHEAARRHQGARPHPRHFRPDLHADAAAARRRGDQDRAARARATISAIIPSMPGLPGMSIPSPRSMPARRR